MGWVRPPRPGAAGPFVSLASAGGRAAAAAGRYPAPAEPGAGEGGGFWTSYPRGAIRNQLAAAANRWGFGRDSYRGRGGHWEQILFPAWLPTTLFAALPLARGALFVRRRRRIREGHCKICGYDLRATPDRCPECGHVPAGVTRAGTA
jgi:hypothetical protein